MKTHLPQKFQSRVGGLLAGMIAAYLLGMLNLCLAGLGAGMVAFGRAGASQVGGYVIVWLLAAASCFWSGRRLARQRSFFLQFGTWAGEGSGSGENPDAALAARAGHAAFEAGDYAKAARIFEKQPGFWLEGAGGHNRASILALLGDLEGLRKHFSVFDNAGPRAKFIRKLENAVALEKIGKMSFSLVPLALAAVFSLGVLAFPVYYFASTVQKYALGLTKEGFLNGEFKHESGENFEIYYHNERYMGWAKVQAESALAYDEAFLALPGDSYKAAKITLILSDNQQELMRRCPSTSSWEAGHAVPSEKCVYIYKTDNYERDPYSLVVLAHELCHILFDKLFPKLDNESWLNEGLANYVGYRYALEKLDYPYKFYLLKNVFPNLTKQHLPFSDFLASNPHKYSDPNIVGLFYTQGFSMVYTLIEHYGKDNFIKFLREYSIDNNIERALSRSYPQIQTLQDLEGIWLLYMT